MVDRNAELARLRAVARDGYDADASVTETQANRYIARRATAFVRGPRVLVLGAAVGAWAEPLIAAVGGFDTVDAVAELVEALVARHPDRVVGHTALFEDFVADRPFDTVVMGHVLEHVVDPGAVLRRAVDWLVPGGRVVITVPNAGSLHRAVGVEMGILADVTAFSPGDVALGHRRVYTPDTLRADVEGAGFAVDELTGLVLKPLSNSQMDTWSDDLRAAYFALGDRFAAHACAILCVATAQRSRTR